LTVCRKGRFLERLRSLGLGRHCLPGGVYGPPKVLA
jgi:hypothetical protein